jgi:hypothetical protein
VEIQHILARYTSCFEEDVNKPVAIEDSARSIMSSACKSVNYELAETLVHSGSDQWYCIHQP